MLRCSNADRAYVRPQDVSAKAAMAMREPLTVGRSVGLKTPVFFFFVSSTGFSQS